MFEKMKLMELEQIELDKKKIFMAENKRKR